MDWDVRVRDVPVKQDTRLQGFDEAPLQRGGEEHRPPVPQKSGKLELYVELIFTKTADWDMPLDPILDKKEEQLDEEHKKQVKKQELGQSSQRDLFKEISIPDEFEEIKDEQEDANKQMYDRPNNHFQGQREGGIGGEDREIAEPKFVIVNGQKKSAY